MQQGTIRVYVMFGVKAIFAFGVYLFFLFNTMTIFSKSANFLEEKFRDSKIILVGHTTVKAVVADSEEKRIKGLSGREKLEDNEGMFFKFEKEDIHGIWMKDMKFPIDIIWFDRFGVIIYVEKNVSPSTYPKVFKPNSPNLYVLEVQAGFFDKNKMMVGDTIDLY